MGDVPQGRAYALKLPPDLRGGKSAMMDVGGVPWVENLATGICSPLEAVCEKVRIPGVTYPELGT